jgi:plastocyanin
MRKGEAGPAVRFVALLAAVLAIGGVGSLKAWPSGPAPLRTGEIRDCNSDSSLCLSGGRFQIEATLAAADGSTGRAHPVALTSDSGYFWFYEPDNVELAVKVLNGCGVNGNYWVFAGGLTNLAVAINVIDAETGLVKKYSSSLGTAFQPILDTAALEACSAAAVTEMAGRNPEGPFFDSSAGLRPVTLASTGSSSIGCSESDTILCLDGRFQVEARWQSAFGAAGSAHAVSLTRNSGYFWFFEPSNVEVIVKRLDACAIGRGQWFFAAGLTDVGVELRLTDTFTGEVKTYSSASGTPFPPIQDLAAFAFCPTPTPTPTATSTPTSTPTPEVVVFTPRAGPTTTPPPGAKTYTVGMGTCTFLSRKFPCFSPRLLHVHRGDLVRWILPSGHSATSGTCTSTSTCTADGRWNSGIHPSPFDFSVRFTQTGTFGYYCAAHYRLVLFERGTIFVDP